MHDEEENDAEKQFEQDLRTMEIAMRMHIVEHLNPLLDPLRIVTPLHAHIVVALLLDPRFVSGELVFDVVPGENRLTDAKAGVKGYTNDYLIPWAVSMYGLLERVEGARGEG